MNIFILDRDPAIAARMQCDKHVVKMPLESAQMLSTAHHVCGSPSLDSSALPFYKLAFKNHPCSIWVRESRANYMWLYNHFKALCAEYKFRYFRDHMSWLKLSDALASPPTGVPADDVLTPFAQAMPDEYKNPDAVLAYRQYYVGEKYRLLNYRNRRRPLWIEEAIDVNALTH